MVSSAPTTLCSIKMAPLQMEYLSDLLRTSTYRSHFRRVSTGLGTGTAGFLRLYDDVFLSTTVFLPPEDEQVSILEYVRIQVRKIDRLIASAEGGLELLDEYRTRLIADVVTGKLDVREAAARHYRRRTRSRAIVTGPTPSPPNRTYRCDRTTT